MVGGELTRDPPIWAYGLPNPFRASWDEGDGKSYLGEVGGNQANQGPLAFNFADDVHVATLDQAGAFYGWKLYGGTDSGAPRRAIVNFDPADVPQPDADLAGPANGDFYSAPIFDIDCDPPTGISIAGGFVYRTGTVPDAFEDAYDGVCFYANFSANVIRFLELDEARTTVLSDDAFEPGPELPGDAAAVVFLAPVIADFAAADTQGDPGDGAGKPPPEVTFTATLSGRETPTADLTYALTFGDGTTAATGAPDPVAGAIIVTHTYAWEGAFDAALTASDGTRTVFATPIGITVGDPNDAPV